MSDEAQVVVQVESEKTAVRADYGELNRRGFYATTSEMAFKRKQTFLEFIPLWVRYTFVAVMGMSILGLPALIISMTKEPDQFLPIEITSRFESSLGEAFRWSALLCAVYGSYYTTMAVICLIPMFAKLFESSSDEESGMRVRDNVKQIMIIRHYIAFPAAALAMLLIVLYLFEASEDSSLIASSPLTNFYMTRLSLTLFVFAFLLMVAKLAINEITINYHYEYYAERMTKNLFGLAAIRKLSKKFPPNRRRGAGTISKSTEEMEREEATFVAVGIFDGLREPGKDLLTLSDFEQVLSSEDARRILSELDVDGNEDLSQKELVEGIQGIYSERDNLNQALSSNDDIVSRLNTLALFLVSAVTGSLCLSIFNISLPNIFLASFSYIMAAKVLFSDLLVSIFATVIFIFVSHPFDVGDVVTLDGKKFKVKHVGWWQSSFYGEGSSLVYYANHCLANMNISNFRRSGAMYDMFSLNVQQDTPKVQILQLEKRLNDFIEKNPRDYTKHTMVNLEQIVNSEDLKLNFAVTHRSNFQNSLAKASRSNKVQQFLRDTVRELGIKLALE
jgi:small-conductance mechanosensitive channel